MKHLCLFLSLFLATSITAQRNQDDIPFSREREFRTDEVPSKWQDEPAVILAQQFEVYYKSFVKKVEYHETLRRRIKIQSQSAADAFSVLTFDEKAEVSAIIIKPDGSKVRLTSVDLKEAEGKPGDHQLTLDRQNHSYRQLALNQLAPGDILDYHYTHVNYERDMGETEMDKFVFPLTQQFPVVYQRFEFQVGVGLQFVGNTFNDAPELRLERRGRKEKGRIGAKVYYVTDTMRQASISAEWTAPALNEPMLKAGVQFQPGREYGLYFDLRDESWVSSVGEKDIANYLKYLENYGSNRNSHAVFLFRKFRSEYGKGKIPKTKETLTESYYYLRNATFLDQVDVQRYSNLMDYSQLTNEKIDNEVFLDQWVTLLQSLEIEHQIFMFQNDAQGAMDQLLFMDDLYFGIKVLLPYEEVYLFPYDNFTTLGQPYVPANNALAWFVDSESRRDVFSDKHHLPVQSADDHTLTRDLSLSLADDQTSLVVKQAITATGAQKERLDKNILYGERLFLNSRYLEKIDKVSYLDKLDESDVKTLNENLDQRRKERSLWRETHLSNNLSISAYSGPELMTYGMYDDDPVLSFKESFQSESLVMGEGDMLLIKTGLLTGTSLLSERPEANRKSDYYFAFPASEKINMTLTIPNGYEVENTDALNFEVDNEHSRIASTTRTVDNTLNISIEKTIKSKWVSSEEWQSMAEVYDAGQKLFNLQLNLKKK